MTASQYTSAFARARAHPFTLIIDVNEFVMSILEYGKISVISSGLCS